MAHTGSTDNLAARRYLLASLAVQWRFRRQARPSGLRPSLPAAAREEGKIAPVSSKERHLMRSHHMLA